MARQSTSGLLLNSRYVATTALESDSLSGAGKGAVRFLVCCRASTDGSLQIYRKDLLGTNQAVGSAYAVTANIEALVVLAMPLNEMCAVFTPSTQPGSVRIEGFSA